MLEVLREPVCPQKESLDSRIEVLLQPFPGKREENDAIDLTIGDFPASRGIGISEHGSVEFRSLSQAYQHESPSRSRYVDPQGLPLLGLEVIGFHAKLKRSIQPLVDLFGRRTQGCLLEEWNDHHAGREFRGKDAKDFGGGKQLRVVHGPLS